MKIHNLRNQAIEEKKLLKLQEHLQKRNFSRVITDANKYIKEHPDQPFFHTIISIAYLYTGDVKSALDILKAAEKKFPKDYQILFHLAKVYEEIPDYGKAVSYFTKSFEATPEEYRDARSDCLNDIGVNQYRMGLTEEAANSWKKALAIDPANHKANDNLNLISGKEVNDSTDFIMNEFREFESVQKDKYFEKTEKVKFSTKKEEKHFHKMTEAFWINEIMANPDRLENSDEEELSRWYEGIEIDFSKSVPKTEIFVKGGDKEKLINDKFPFLPKNGIKTALLAGPAMDYAGLNIQKIQSFIKGELPTEKEIEKLKWSYSLGEILLKLGNTESVKIQNELLDKFIETLQFQLSGADTRIVLDKIISSATKI